MKNSIAFIIGFCFCANVLAQDCSCPLNFDHLVDNITRNYSGFQDKVNHSTLPTYNSMLDSLTAESRNANSPHTCFKLMQTYTAFFYDHHIWLAMNGAGSDANQNTAPIEIVTLEIDLEQFKESITNAMCLDPLCGIWETDNYTIGIKKDASDCDRYVAFIIETTRENWGT